MSLSAVAWVAAAVPLARLARAAPLPHLPDVTRHEGYNCFEGHGGRRIDLDTTFADPFPENIPVEECHHRCLRDDRCEAFLIVGRHVEDEHPAEGPCWLRSEVRLEECDRGTGAEPYDLFMVTGRGPYGHGDDEDVGFAGETVHAPVSKERVAREDEAEEEDEDSSFDHIGSGFLLAAILVALCLFLVWAVWYITGHSGGSTRGAKLIVEPQLETHPVIVEEHPQVVVEPPPPPPPPDMIAVVRPPRPPPYIPPPEPAAPSFFTFWRTGLTRDSYVPGKAPLVWRSELAYAAARPDCGPEAGY